MSSSSPFLTDAANNIRFTNLPSIDANPGFTGQGFTGTTKNWGTGGGITLTGGSSVANNQNGGSITITGGTARPQFTSIQYATQADLDHMQREIDGLKKLVSDLVDKNQHLEDEIEAIKDGALLD